MPALVFCRTRLRARRLSPASVRPLLGSLLAALGLSAGPAHAVLDQAAFSILHDGTPGFDSSDAPGMDSGPQNLVVRTHDEVRYQLQLNSVGAEQDIVVQLTLPADAGGQPIAVWQHLPVGCEAGSTLSTDRQRISCRLSDFDSSGARTLQLPALVLGSNRNGSLLPAPTLQISSRSQVQPRFSSTPGTVRISAAPFYDIKLDNSFHGIPRAHGFLAGSGPNGEDGFFHRHLIGVIARHPNGHGRKGVEQLDPSTPIQIELDLSGYQSSVRLVDWRTPANTPTPANLPSGSFADGCGSPGLGSPGKLAGDHVNAHDRVNDSGPDASTNAFFVANGGDCEVSHLDLGNRTVGLQLNGVDTRLEHTPTRTYNANNGVPATDAWVANKALVLWTDLKDYPVNQPVWNTLSLLRVSGRSISGQALQHHSPTQDRSSAFTLTNQLLLSIMSNFGPDRLAPPWGSFPDPNVRDDQHVNQMAPGQSAYVYMRITNFGSVPLNNAMLCEKIDRSAFDPAPHFNSVGLDAPGTIIRFGAPPAGVSPYFASTDSIGNVYDNEPATGQSAYSQARCDDPGIRWFDTWQEAEAAGGLVYVRFQRPQLLGGENMGALVFGLRLRERWAGSVHVEHPPAPQRQAGSPIAFGSIIRNKIFAYADNHPHNDGKWLIDHVQAVPTMTTTRLQQRITQPADAGTNPVAANTVLGIELTPTYSTLYPPVDGIVTVKQVLPDGLRYLRGSATRGGQPAEPQIIPDSPASGLTTLVWTYPPQKPFLGQEEHAPALPPISFQAQLRATLPDDAQLILPASVDGGAYDHQQDCRFDPNTQDYGDCLKAQQLRLVVKTAQGFLQEKLVNRDTVEAGDPIEYRLRFISAGEALPAADLPDIIDILPFVGDGTANPALGFAARTPASRFQPGAYRLHSVSPADIDPGARIYYTRRDPAAIHNDPRHASNQIPGGSTRWCLAQELGSTDCPASIGDSTAVRISPALSSLAANTPYELKLRLATDPVRAQPGDRLSNRAGMAPVAPNASLIYVVSQDDLSVGIAAAGAGLSGRSFADLDQNNRFDPDDRALPAQCIRLDGTLPGIGAISLSTRTDAEGRFGFTPQAAHQVFASSDCSGTALPLFAGLREGSYTLSKPQPAASHQPGRSHAGSLGGSIADDSIRDIPLGPRDSGTDYHFTEVPAPAALSLRAAVNNDHGGNASIGDFELHLSALDGTRQLGGTGGSAALNRVSLPGGRYRLGHSGRTGYRLSHWQCLRDAQATENIPLSGTEIGLSAGEHAVCTAYFDDLPARLTLAKRVTNTQGQQARPTDFMLHASGPASFSGRSGSAAVTNLEVPAGSYTLREDNLPNYVAGAWHCSAGTQHSPDGSILTLLNGDEAVCTIDNTDQPISLTLSLDVINRHGGTARAADHVLEARWLGTADAPGAGTAAPEVIRGISGAPSVTVAPVKAGVHRLNTPALPGYETGPWRCSGGVLQGERLTLAEQQNVSCRIELKDMPATLKLQESVQGEVQPIEGTDSDYLLQYRIDVQHQGGADGLYSLLSAPAFDADVQILSATASLNGQALPLTTGSDGRWTLVSRQRIGIGAADSYQLLFRIRVPYGSSTANNRCATTGSAEGHGLFNRVLLDNHAASPSDASPVLQAVACIDTPVPISKAALSIDKRSTSRSAEVGDLITYQLRIRNNGSGAAISPVVVDRLPAGFRLDPGSLRVQGATRNGVQISGNRELRIQLDRIEAGAADTLQNAPGTGTALRNAPPRTPGDTASAADPNRVGNGSIAAGEVLISYRVRLGVGAQEGDGTNRAHVECPTPNGASTTRCSNESRWKIQVKAGIFSEEACLAGQIFVDCNGNSVKDAEELGIPGVRLYLQNGTWLVSDAHGKYSHCGLRPRTHVLKVDGRTLPRRARLVTSSAQNSGDAESLFIDARKGMLHRADFIEGSCSATVIEQVKARQAALGADGIRPAVGTDGPGQPSAAPATSKPGGFWFDSRREPLTAPGQSGASR